MLRQRNTVAKTIKICLTQISKLLTVASIEMVLRRVFGSAVAALALEAGCATTEQQPQSPEQAVKARAQQRWDTLIKGDIEAAYGYLSPGSRAVNTLESYKGSIRPGFWKSARVADAKCNAALDSCEVASEIEYEFRGGRVKSPLNETWIRQEGNWWYVLK